MSPFLILAAVIAQVPTSQYNNARTGANLSETILTPESVNAARFGKTGVLRVDGDVYAQPLYLGAVNIPGKGQRNLVLVATEHDSVYAFDADLRESAPLWHVSFLGGTAGATTLSARDVECPFIVPEIGITSTPVIDPATGTLYVLARTKESGRLFGRFVQRLHALAVTTGQEKFGGPVEIKASVAGRAREGSHGVVVFDPLHENPRAALLLSNNTVYMAWASSCDNLPYHGWVMAYDAATLSQKAVFNVSRDGSEGGIWLGDTGPAADSLGNVYLPTGNGVFDASKGGRDYGDSLLKLSPTLALKDFFTPFNEVDLKERDNDLGSGGPLLLPDQPGAHPHLLVVAGKGGTIYLLDRDGLGRFHTGGDAVVQALPIAGEGAFSAPAYWSDHLFYLCSHDFLKDFAVRHGRLSGEPVRHGSREFIDPGATPTVSANGSRSGIVWVIASKGWRSPDQPAILYAYDASDVTRELYSSSQMGRRDEAGKSLRFTIPTVINGRVYVGTKGEVDVYGLLRAH